MPLHADHRLVRGTTALPNTTMSSSEDAAHIDKGKSRAHPTDPSERTPLLASQSSTSRDDTDLETTSRSRRRLWSKLIFIFLVTLSICKSNWCFAAAFNGGFTRPHEEFDHLVQFNRVDWTDARSAILQASEILRGEAISKTGQWALAYILRATGASPDCSMRASASSSPDIFW